MTSPTNPLGKPPRDPYENYRVESVEKDKKEGSRPPFDPKERKPSTMQIMAVYALSLIRKILDLIQRGLGGRNSASRPMRLAQHLLLFKTSIEIMKQKDESQNGPFLSSLVSDWHRLSADLKKMNTKGPIETGLRELIQKIQSYPKEAEHTFGYYLSEHVGQKWLPFPFIEMVRKMHIEHQKSPSTSELSDWSSKIDALLVLTDRTDS